jgi:iron complex outermembrane receptor protein
MSLPTFRLRGGISLLALCAIASPAYAAPAAPTTPDDGQIVVVTGRRLSEAAQSIGEDQVTNTVAVTRKALLSAPAGVSGLKMLEQLPGFNVQTDGALGLYEFGNSVQSRAYNLDQIGFVVDGIPTGRSDAFGGSPVFRYVDNENLASVVASVGAGDVAQPSYSSLGPVVEYKSVAPQDKLGLFVSGSLGDFNMRRNFVRFSTGQIGPVKAYVSRTKLDSNLWRGAGGVHREHYEAQIQADYGSGNWLRAKFVSNYFNDNDSPTLARSEYYSTTPDIGGQTGRWRGYYAFVPNTTAGFTPTTAGVPYSNPNYANLYYQSINHRNDKLYGLTNHVELGGKAWAETTLYWEDKSGWGSSPDTYDNSLTRYTAEKSIGLNVYAPKGSQFGVSALSGDRYGVVQKFHWETGVHTLEAGIWAEIDKYARLRLRYNTTDGSPTSAPDYSQPVFLRANYHTQRETKQLFIKDKLSLLNDKLEVTAGIKGLILDYTYNGYRDYADYYRVVGGVAVAGYGLNSNTAHYKDLFLPLVGALYKLDNRTQVFTSYAENTALPKGLDDIYSVTLANSSGGVPQPAAEKSQNAEIGIRTRQREFFASASLYYTAYKNRIQSTVVPVAGAVGVTETIYTNVGRVEAYGLEATGSYKPAFLHGLAYFNLNATYNHARLKDNVYNGSTVRYYTAGKALPDSAEWTVNGGVTVEPASWLVANFSGKYTSSRWSTLDNSAGSKVNGYTVYSAYVDIGDGWHVGPLKSVKARLNIDNVFDRNTLGYISTTATGDGLFRPLSPRTFQATLSAEY